MVKLHVLVCDMEEKIQEAAKKVSLPLHQLQWWPPERLTNVYRARLDYYGCLRNFLRRAQDCPLNHEAIR